MRAPWLALLFLPLLAPTGEAQPTAPCVDFHWAPITPEPAFIVPADRPYRAYLYYNVTYGRVGQCSAPPCFGPSDHIQFEMRSKLRPHISATFSPNPAPLDLIDDNLSRQASSVLEISAQAEAEPDILFLYQVRAWGCGYPELGGERWIRTAGEVAPSTSDILAPRERSPGLSPLWVLVLVVCAGVVLYRTR